MTKEQQLIEKERDLYDLRLVHEYAARTYGSELCVKSMLDDERRLEDEIVQLRLSCLSTN